MDPYRGHPRSGINVEEIWVDAIDQAKSSIDLAVYELRLPLVAKALVNAHKRGVKVRLVLENQNNLSLRELGLVTLPDNPEEQEDYSFKRLKDYFAYVDVNHDLKLSDQELTDRDAIEILRTGAVPIIDDKEDGSKGSGLMHHKFMVIDQHLVFTGSGNLTWSDLHGDALAPKTIGNANNFITFDHKEVAKVFLAEFAVLWGDGPGGQKNGLFGVKKPYRGFKMIEVSPGLKVGIQFGATSKTVGYAGSVNGTIATYLRRAKKSLEAALFVWSDQALLNELKSSFGSGIPGQGGVGSAIQVLIEPFFGYRYYSELLDLLGVEMLSDRCVIEKGNLPWALEAVPLAGLPRLEPGDALHHKFAVVDSQVVIAGSQNWSANANQNNDETLIVLESATFAKQYHEAFQKLMTGAELGVTFRLDQKIKEAKVKCGVTP